MYIYICIYISSYTYISWGYYVYVYIHIYIYMVINVSNNMDITWEYLGDPVQDGCRKRTSALLDKTIGGAVRDAGADGVPKGDRPRS